MKPTPLERKLFYASLACGFPHPRLMLEKLSSTEYAELLTFLNYTPIGAFRLDLLASLIINVIGQAFGGEPLKEPILLEDNTPETGEELERKAYLLLRSLTHSTKD